MSDKYFNHLLSFILALNIPSSYYNNENDEDNTKSSIVYPNEIIIEENKNDENKENESENKYGESKEEIIEKQSIQEEKEEL